eukprot:6008793-Prymnesium_polylepis.1
MSLRRAAHVVARGRRPAHVRRAKRAVLASARPWQACGPGKRAGLTSVRAWQACAVRRPRAGSARVPPLPRPLPSGARRPH